VIISDGLSAAAATVPAQPARGDLRNARSWQRGVTIALLGAATVVGVEFGLSAPAVSPVSAQALAPAAHARQGSAFESPATSLPDLTHAARTPVIRAGGGGG
jgi:hypothetical protein